MLATSPTQYKRPRRTLAAFPVPLEPGDFRRFLASKPADEPVGVCLEPWECPLHEWIATLQAGHISVVPSVWIAVGRGRGRTYYRCPRWLSRFGLTLDRCHCGTVTAADCLAVLDAIEGSAA